MNRKKSVNNTGVKEFNRKEASKRMGVEIPFHIKNEEELCIWSLEQIVDGCKKIVELFLNTQKQE